MLKDLHTIIPGRGITYILIILLSGLFPTHIRAVDYTVQTVPNVILTDKNNRVSNPDGIISPEDVQAINNQLRILEDSTGIEVAVVAIESIGDNDARMFATDLFKYWGIGKKADDNGLLIQLVTEPRQRSVVFETGYGIEGVLPDAICYRLQQQHMIPDMRNGDYSSGMVKGVIAVKEYLLAGDYERQAMLGSSSASGEDKLSLWGVFLFVFFPFGGIIVFMLVSSWLKNRPKVCPSCGKKAYVFVRRQTIQKATYSSEGLAVDIYRCKNCGYTENKNRRINKLRHSTTPPVVVGGGRSRGGFGGGFSGGSWGGGRSGGGGSISRF